MAASVPLAPHLVEGVHGEAAGALEPTLVARSRERLQEGVAVPGDARLAGAERRLAPESSPVPGLFDERLDVLGL